ncbi:hypothetical protein MMC25_007746 [Agyrium rufum]|nr:hypothetical protein [Agyrium rufum]
MSKTVSTISESERPTLPQNLWYLRNKANSQDTDTLAPLSPNEDDLYVVIFTIRDPTHDVNGEVEKVRAWGTYRTLKAAKEVARTCLFDAGYERAWFETIKSHPDEFADAEREHNRGLVLLAVAKDKTMFSVSIATTRSLKHLEADEKEKIQGDLYHVLRTNVFYSEDDGGHLRQTISEGIFMTAEEARKCAKGVLRVDGVVPKDSFARYTEVQEGESDTDYDDDVVVYAIGLNGENILVRVLKAEG